MWLRISCLILIFIVFAPVRGHDEENETQTGGYEMGGTLTWDSNVTTISASEDVKAAIRTFLREYKRQHRTPVRRYKLVNETQYFEGPYYTSGLLRLDFEVERDSGTYSSSVLLKIPDLGRLHDYAEEMRYYVKEKFMYEKVIPMLYKNTPFEKPSPNFYGATESGILVLENLREFGFGGKTKSTMVDLQTWMTVWRTLAQFHALSTLHLGRLSEHIDNDTVMDRTDSQWIREIFPPIAQKLRRYVLPTCSPSVSAELDELLKNVPSAINLGFAPNANGFDVILHGDAHLSNVLFANDTRGDLKVKLVDFQSSRRGSPIIDLMYFTIISVPFETFDEHRDRLFNFYVAEFNNVLEIMGARYSNMYTMEMMEADFERHRQFFFFVVCSAGPTLWAGDQGAGHSSGRETGLDVVLKSDRYISAFHGWTKHFF